MPRARTVAILCGLSHFVFALWIQASNRAIYHPVAPFTSENFWLTWPLLQIEHLAAAFIVALAAFLAAQLPAARRLAPLVPLVANLYLAVDQIGYGLFGDHIKLSFDEGGTDFGVLKDSLLHELGPLFFFNLAFALTLLLACLKLTRSASVAAFLGRLRVPALGALVLYAPLGLYAAKIFDNANIEHHAAFSFLEDFLVPAPGFPKTGAILPDYDMPSAPDDPFPADTQKEKLAAIRTNARRMDKPNVILIVLESVGSDQILPHKQDGVPAFDPAITPNLERLSRHAAVFDSVYAVFPGTVRSHIAMNTGGPALTWGSVFEDLKYAYGGPTLKGCLAGAGYATGLFSAGSLDVENMDLFFEKLGYDVNDHPGKYPQDEKDRHAINSWGMDERHTWDKALSWIDSVRKKDKPFFLQLFTISTHHPYSTAKDHVPPFPAPQSDKQSYLNSLHFNDAVLGRAVKRLEEKGLLDDTLIFITGDHGEAFQEWHADNRLHKNRLYEENVKSFLALINAAAVPEATVSSRVAGLADLPATVAALSGIPDCGLPGRDLFAPDFANRIVFFHKNAAPEHMGLRDGRWKYIVNMVGAPKPELYDLAADPREQRNLAGLKTGLAADYDERLRSWYVDAHNRFIAALEGYDRWKSTALESVDLSTPGPKMLAVGYQDGAFHEAALLNPYEQPRAKLKLVTDNASQRLSVAWRSPSGKTWKKAHHIVPEWTNYTTNDFLEFPLEEGEWKVHVEQNRRVLLEKEFIVDADAPLSAAGKSRLPGLERVEIRRSGDKRKSRSAGFFAPDDDLTIATAWRQNAHRLRGAARLTFTAVSPSGERHEFEKKYYGGPKDLENLDLPRPLESGRWMIIVSFSDGRELGRSEFRISPYRKASR